MRNTTFAATIAAGLGLLSFNVMADYSTTVGGKIFADMTHISAQNDGKDADPTGTGLDLKRFYFTVDHDFTDMWSANLTTDATYSSTSKLTDIYIKKAYVQANFIPEAMLRLGSADLPWVPYAEGDNGYGFRYIEPIQIDRLKFGTSADWGMHFLGKANDGMFSYAASAVNGNGYKNPTRSKTLDLEGRLGFQPLKGLNFAVGGYTGKLGQDTVANSATPYRTANRIDAMVSYVQPTYRVGTEWFKAENWKVKEADPKNSADGYSVWGSVSPLEHYTVFARYDSAKPNKDINPSMTDKYYNLGVQYEARKNVKLALVYKHEAVDNITTATPLDTANFKYTGNKDGRFSEIGLFTEVKF